MRLVSSSPGEADWSAPRSASATIGEAGGRERMSGDDRRERLVGGGAGL